MAEEMILMLLGAAFTSVLPNAVVAIYDWFAGTGKGNSQR